MRTVNVSELTKSIKEMCIEANHYLSKDMETTLKCARETEASPLGKQILNQLSENLKIAADDMIPICQDTGMAVVFLEIGQDVHLEGGSVEDAVNEGVRLGYTEGFLRKSVVRDPIERVNTGDNTPVSYTHLVINLEHNIMTTYHYKMHQEDLAKQFGRWYRLSHGNKKTICLLGIRADESLQRYSGFINKRHSYKNQCWITQQFKEVYSGSPLYDWSVEDIWHAYYLFDYPYNKLYLSLIHI